MYLPSTVEPSPLLNSMNLALYTWNQNLLFFIFCASIFTVKQIKFHVLDIRRRGRTRSGI